MTIPPSLPRDPTLSDRYDPRTRRFIDNVAAMLNSLVESGVLVLTGPSEWELSAALDQFILASRVFALRPPLAGPVGGTDQAVLSQQTFGRKGSYGMFGG